MVMHVEYLVRLSDHDFAVGSRHQLTPSVYAGIVIKPDAMERDAVTYSGPTYLAIRSGKHSSSTAATHENDLRKLFNLSHFESLVKTADGKIKPVLMLSVDGGPDENPRFSGVILNAVSHFQEYDLDALFIFTNAPGRSAFNRVERRMAPLSRELSGVVLPHDNFGSHLDGNGRTIDDELELKNFNHEGNCQTEIWSEMDIDGYRVLAGYVGPEEEIRSPPALNQNWYSKHVRESQYLLQIVKCQNMACCSAPRSHLRDVLFQRILPAPYPLCQHPFKIPTPEEADSERFPPLLVRQTQTLRPQYPLTLTRQVPYHFYCPSQKKYIDKRICPLCGIYFASQTSVAQHRSVVHGGRGPEPDEACTRPLRVLSQRPGELLCRFSEDTCEWVDVESVDCEGLDVPEREVSLAPIISTLNDWINQGITFVEV